MGRHLGGRILLATDMYIFFLSFFLSPAHRIRLRCSTTDDSYHVFFLFLPVLLYIFCRVDVLPCVFWSALDLSVDLIAYRI